MLADEATVVPGQVLKVPPLAAPAAASPPERRGVIETDLENLARHLPTPGAETAARRIYVVRHGDCLAKIARKVFNDDSRAAIMKIFNANRDKLDSPDRLPVGVSLEIPS